MTDRKPPRERTINYDSSRSTSPDLDGDEMLPSPGTIKASSPYLSDAETEPMRSTSSRVLPDPEAPPVSELEVDHTASKDRTRVLTNPEAPPEPETILNQAVSVKIDERAHDSTPVLPDPEPTQDQSNMPEETHGAPKPVLSFARIVKAPATEKQVLVLVPSLTPSPISGDEPEGLASSPRRGRGPPVERTPDPFPPAITPRGAKDTRQQDNIHTRQSRDQLPQEEQGALELPRDPMMLPTAARQAAWVSIRQNYSRAEQKELKRQWFEDNPQRNDGGYRTRAEPSTPSKREISQSTGRGSTTSDSGDQPPEIPLGRVETSYDPMTWDRDREEPARRPRTKGLSVHERLGSSTVTPCYRLQSGMPVDGRSAVTAVRASEDAGQGPSAHTRTPSMHEYYQATPLDVGEGQTKAQHEAFRHLYNVTLRYGLECKEHATKTSRGLPIPGTTDVHTGRVWPSVDVSRVGTGTEEHYRNSNLTLKEDEHLGALQTREDNFLGKASLIYEQDRKGFLECRLYILSEAIQRQTQVTEAKGKGPVDNDTIDCPVLQKLCQDYDQVTEHICLGKDQITLLNERVFREGDRPIPHKEMVEMVMSVQTQKLFDVRTAALEEVRKQCVLLYFLDGTSLSPTEKLRPTTKYGLFQLTSGLTDPRATRAKEIELSLRISEMHNLGPEPPPENPVIAQQQRLLQQHNDGRSHAAARETNRAPDPLLPPGFERPSKSSEQGSNPGKPETDSRPPQQGPPPGLISFPSKQSLVDQGFRPFIVYANTGDSVKAVLAEPNVTYTPENWGHKVPREQDVKFITLPQSMFYEREFLIGAPTGARDHLPEFDSAGARPYRVDRKGVPLDTCHRLGRTYKILYARTEEDLMLYVGEAQFSSAHNTPPVHLAFMDPDPVLAHRRQEYPFQVAPFQVAPRRDYIFNQGGEAQQGGGRPVYRNPFKGQEIQPARFLRRAIPNANRLGENGVIPHLRESSGSNRVHGYQTYPHPPTDDNQHSHSDRFQLRPQADRDVDDIEHGSGTPLSAEISARVFVHEGDQCHLDTTQGFGWFRVGPGSQMDDTIATLWNAPDTVKTFDVFGTEGAHICVIVPSGPSPFREKSQHPTISLSSLRAAAADELQMDCAQLDKVVDPSLFSFLVRTGFPGNFPESTRSPTLTPSDFSYPLNAVLTAFEREVARAAAPEGPPRDEARGPQGGGSQRPYSGSQRGPRSRRSRQEASAQPNWDSKRSSTYEPNPMVYDEENTSLLTAFCKSQGKGLHRLKIDVVVYEDGICTGLTKDVRDHASITVQGEGLACSQVLHIWATKSCLPARTVFSREWSQPNESSLFYTDAKTYLRKLWGFCTTHTEGDGMNFPFPWKPLYDGHLTFLQNENLGFPEYDSDVEVIELDSTPQGTPPDPLGPLEGPSLIRPHPKRVPVVKQEFPNPAVETSEPNKTVKGNINEVSLQTHLSRVRFPDSSEVPQVKPTAFPDHPGDPHGTHLGLTILGNLLVQQRRRYDEDLMDVLKQEYEKMVRAPKSVSDNMLHPYFRDTDRPWSPGEEPMDCRITLTAMPSFDAVTSDVAQYPCSRCGEMSSDANFLRRVRGLLSADWTGPQRCPPPGMRPLGPLQGSAADSEAPYIFFCCLCVFPADPTNRPDQELYFWNGHFRPRHNPSVPDTSGTLAPGPPGRPPYNWGDSSDSDYHPTPQVPPLTPEAPTPVGGAALSTSHYEPRTPRTVQPGNDDPCPSRAATPASAAENQWDYLLEKYPPKAIMTSKEVSDKHRLIKLVDDVWIKMVPKWDGVYNDTDALALFWQRVRDTMQRETIFEDCIQSGLPRPELLHRLLVLRLEPTSLVYSHLKPLWHDAGWRNARLADIPTMIKYLSRISLDKAALTKAERLYLAFKRRAGEGSIELLIRLRVVYDTARLSPTFEYRLPEHTLPETLVRSLDDDLHLLVCEGLDRKWLAWKREKMERQKRVSPEQILRALTKIQQEIEIQLQILKAITRAQPPPRYQPPMDGMRRPNPFKRRPPAVLSMSGNEDSERLKDPGETESDDGLYSLGPPKTQSPPTARPPIGSLGPRVPPTARRTPHTSNGPSADNRRPREPAVRGQYTLGDPNYKGCHNCSDKGHMMRDCPKPAQDRVAALVAHETWDTRDAFAFIAQGMPMDLEQLWDPEEVRLYCLELINQDPYIDHS